MVKILLAEDNEVNQYLVCELLKSWGMQVDTARNGFEAIEKWSKTKYDLILMDIQMPELGGEEATAEIRNRATENSGVPIIALSANALKGQKEKMIASGMNDYLSKPFNEAELHHKILAFLPEQTKTLIVIPKTTVIYDFSRLEKILNGNTAFERKLLGVFIDTVPDSVAKLRIACQQGDIQNIATTAHKLKTTIHAMSIDELRAPIQELEDMANAQSNSTQLSSLVNEVTNALDSIVQQFRERLAE